MALTKTTTMKEELLNKLHNAYLHFSGGNRLAVERRGVTDVSEASELIAEHLLRDEPCMIARYGSNELDTICNYMGVSRGGNIISAALPYILDRRPQWWWDEKLITRMHVVAGVFPGDADTMSRFAERMIDDSPQVDVLGSWRPNESYMRPYFKPGIRFVDREKLNPFFAKKPWTLALEGKKVLVVHPFVESIKQQYARKDRLFPHPVLPDFQLQVLPAVMSHAGNSRFADWFEALAFMEQEIDQADFDVALLGCGAYGFPLAAHIKRQGRKAVHIGGSLQLFFGIKGKRWESEGYKGGPNDYSTLFNEYWVYPSTSERPATIQRVESLEGNCYW